MNSSAIEERVVKRQAGVGSVCVWLGLRVCGIAEMCICVCVCARMRERVRVLVDTNINIQTHCLWSPEAIHKRCWRQDLRVYVCVCVCARACVRVCVYLRACVYSE